MPVAGVPAAFFYLSEKTVVCYHTEMLIENRKARFNYELQEKLEAGIELLGLEVKSLRAKQGSLEGAYVIVRSARPDARLNDAVGQNSGRSGGGNEAFLVNLFIPPYQPKNTPKEYEPRRNRKLLLTKKEMAELAGVESKKGLTIVPISVYNKGRKIKVELAVARGKKKYDKRETIKKRETEREIRREMKEEAL